MRLMKRNYLHYNMITSDTIYSDSDITMLATMLNSMNGQDTQLNDSSLFVQFVKCNAKSIIYNYVIDSFLHLEITQSLIEDIDVLLYNVIYTPPVQSISYYDNLIRQISDILH